MRFLCVDLITTYFHLYSNNVKFYLVECGHFNSYNVDCIVNLFFVDFYKPDRIILF